MSTVLLAADDPFNLFNQVVSNNTLNPTYDTFNTVGAFLGFAINVLLGISLAVSLIAVIASGIQIMASQGDPKALNTARGYFTAAVKAIALTIAAFVIKAIVLNIIGASSTDISNATPGF